jgi:hypothetical protein
VLKTIKCLKSVITNNRAHKIKKAYYGIVRNGTEQGLRHPMEYSRNATKYGLKIIKSSVMNKKLLSII